ncbi:MAG: hypothetical protein AVO38_15610 [delta proteobacterium ML8_D]|jgi:hypothetical protein|nr:MAG: hypothetical protein AVO38_15610 [delta proteobacterium ML8_D]
MGKRYQIFVSSTYADLKKERSKVIQTLMEMDCIPAGMELFPAADEEQFEFIKRVIDDCDYYLLIIGGRYGSVTAEGVSYTEKEYDYAIDNGIRVIALLHENPDEIPVGKSDIEPVMRERLMRFREKVATNRLVKFWKSAEDLPGLVALSLSKTIKMYPAVGWIRSDKGSNEQLLSEINELRKENEKLKESLASIVRSVEPQVDNIAALDEKVSVSVRHYDSYYKRYEYKQVQTSWAEIFYFIGPSLLKHPNDESVSYTLGSALFEKESGSEKSAKIKDHDFETIRIQLSALNLINTQYSQTTKGGMALFWSITEKGSALMMELRTIRTNK